MENLQSLMSCLDEISSQIPDGIYLKMADQMKRVHDHMNGNKPIHEDTFYYSDDDSVLESDNDSDSDFEASPPRRVLITPIRNQLLDYVKKMHQEYKVLMKWEKEARRTFDPIKRMNAFRKSQAIKQWCVKNVRWAPGGEAGELVGYLSTAAVNGPTSGWTWKNLMENGLRTIVLEIGTEEEKVPDFIYYDDLSLKTIQKLPAFEKKIYDDYKEQCQKNMTEYFNNAKLKVLEEQANMTKWEVLCVETEEKLTQIDACVYHRDYWESGTKEFWVASGQMVDSGFVARVEQRR